MSITNFLFNGSPPPSTTTYGTATANLPQWYSDYTQGLLEKANSIAAEPYQAYGGPRVANFGADQNRAFQMTRNAAGNFQPNMTAAGSAMKTATGMNPLTAASGNLNAAAAMSPIGKADPFFSGAMSSGAAGMGNASAMLGNAAGQNGAAAAAANLNAAAGVNAQTSAQPYMQQAGGINAVNAAQPYLGAASQTAPGAVSSYMNPYNDLVTNRIADLAGRNLRENLMPAVGDQFVRAGQVGSSRMQEAVGRALRDTQEGALAQQAQVLQQGYGQAQQAFQTDAARLAQIGQTQGNLALGQQQNLGQLAATAGNLANQRQQNLTAIGAQQGNLTNQYGQLLGSLGQTQGNLANQWAGTQAQIGNQAGQLMSQQQNTLANIGQTQGNLQNAAQQNMMQAGLNYGTLAGQQQQYGLRDAAAMSAIGDQQQQLQQRSLDTAYNDFLEQRQYPWQMVGNLNSAIRGMQMPTSTATSQTGPASSYQASPLSNLVGGLSLYNSLNRT